MTLDEITAKISGYVWDIPLIVMILLAGLILTLCLIFFAFTTILGWDFYGEKCLDYLSHGNKVARYIYRFLYIAAILAGPYLTVAAVWNIADIFNGLMAVPNIFALFMLSKEAVGLLRENSDCLRRRRI